MRLFRKRKIFDYKKLRWVSNFTFTKPCTNVYPYEDTITFITLDSKPLKRDLIILPHGKTGRSIMYEVIETFPSSGNVHHPTKIRYVSKEKSEKYLKKYG